MPIEASDALLARLKAVLEPRPEVREAYLFGSRARGDAAPHSDVDVAVWLDPARREEAPFGWIAEVSAELGTALGAALDRPDVDLVVLNDAPPLLYHRVLRDGIRVFSRDLAATTTREGRALSRYCDDLPRLARIAAAHDRRLRRGAFGR